MERMLRNTHQVPSPSTHSHDISHLLRRAQAPNGDIPDITRRALDRLLPGDHARVPDHGGRHVVHRDAVAGELPGQVPHQPLQAALGRGVVAAVDAAAVGREAADEDDPAPPPLLHGGHAELGEEEAGAEVDAEGVVELLQGDVEDVGDPLAVAGVADEDVRAGLAVLARDLLEQALDVLRRGHVGLVRRDSGAGPLRQCLELADEGVYGGLVLRVRQG